MRELEGRLADAARSHPPLRLSPAWWQERLLEWATTDPDFRVKLLQFVDVLPTLRTARAVADHVRQYFRGSSPGLVQRASGLASQPVFRPVLSRAVRSGVFAMADRFIAGETPEQAIPRLRELARGGVASTVDLLGEETLSDIEADAYLARYTALIETLTANAAEMAPHGEQWAGVPPVNVSIKLSALCPHLEPAAPEWVSETAATRLRPLLRAAMAGSAFINFDVEQYRYKDLVQRAFASAVQEPEFAGYPHFGIVVQAYLRDAEDDIGRLRALAEKRGAPFSVRLVKGAYWDEENIVAGQNGWVPPIFQEKHETDDSYDRCTDALLEAWPHLRPAFGSHNPHSVAQAMVKSQAAARTANDIEFQMLYGMAEGLREAVAADGYRTRVYVPVGEVIPGMAYLVRRLLENTSNQAWFNAGVTIDSIEAVHPKPSTDGAGGRDEGAFTNASPAQFFEPVVRQRIQDAIDHERAGFGRSYPLLIGDRKVSDRDLADITYPAEPSTVIGCVAQATAADVDRAVEIAREAYPAWRDTPANVRSEALRRAAAITEERRYELVATMVYETGKPWGEADGDVTEAIDFLRYYSQQAEELERPRRMGDTPGEHSVYFHQGRGVAAIIAPWNFPLAIITGMTTGALAGGNAAILKPASQSPIIAARLAGILREAGVPAETVQYLPGSGGEAGQALVEHPGVDTIAFTGSNAVGLQMIEDAAKTRPGQRNVKRVIAEMGGKNAIVIDDDADLDQAVGGTLASAFGYAGQKCSACSRLIIVGTAYEEAVERLRNGVASLVVGPPHAPETFVPPVVSARAKETIESYIEAGRKDARLLVQGEAPAGGGHYVRPTVFVDVPLDSRIAREEIFGPVLSVFHAKTFEEALELAVDSPFALTGGVYSRNPRHIELARRRFRTGNLYVNRKTTGAIVGRHPFGGTAMSGIGEKAGGPDYVRQFMEAGTITENTVRRGFSAE